MCCVALDFARDKVAGDDSACPPFHNNNIEQLPTGVHGNGSCLNLSGKCAIPTQKALLTGLPFGIKSSANLNPAKRAVVDKTTIVAGEGHTDGGVVIDNQIAHLGSPVNVRLAGSVIAPFHHVVEQSENAIAIVLVVFGSIYTTLSCNRVSTSWGVLVAKDFNIIAQLSKG